MPDEGEWFPVTYTVDTLIWAYSYTCKRDHGTGGFCAPIFDEWAWAKANTGPGVCTDCILDTYQLRLSNDLGYDDGLASSFAALTSLCNATGYAVTVPPPNTIDATAAAAATATSRPATKSCASMYIVQEGDDCHSISIAQRVSTSALLYLNNLEAGCTRFAPIGTQLCMPPTCDLCTVQPKDTCWAIIFALHHNFGRVQLLSWNVDIRNDCENLEMLTGHQICVSWPGETTPEEEVMMASAPATATSTETDVGQPPASTASQTTAPSAPTTTRAGSPPYLQLQIQP